MLIDLERDRPTRATVVVGPEGGIEPAEPNITALLEPANLKWKGLVSRGVEIPTLWEKTEFDRMDNAYQKIRGEVNARIAGTMCHISFQEGNFHSLAVRLAVGVPPRRRAIGRPAPLPAMSHSAMSRAESAKMSGELRPMFCTRLCRSSISAPISSHARPTAIGAISVLMM